jgi:RimJ/RimL family protein N-acetyltransferase
VIVTDGPRVAAFVGTRCGTAIVPPFTALGWERDGDLVAGCIFNVYTGPDIEVTVAAEPGGITRAFIRACGHYVFTQLGCERVTFTTEQPNVINLAHRLAAQTEGRKRHQYGKGRDGIVLGLLREDWKLL